MITIVKQNNKNVGAGEQGSRGAMALFSSAPPLLRSSAPLLLFAALALFGCASTDETKQMQSSIGFISNEQSQSKREMNQFKREMNTKLSTIAKEQESLRSQFINLSTTIENNNDKIRTMHGKLDELDHQLQTYWKDTKAEITALKTEMPKPQAPAQSTQTPLRPDNTKYEAIYKEAFDAFQKAAYDDAITKLSDFIMAYPGTPLVSNAYYWLGESYLNLKNYEKAIVNFQEVVDKYPKSDKASRALLSQAEAFGSVKDEKSSVTILKKVIELYPKTEEAVIAERKLRSLGLR